jgi:hypothetical protein
MKTLYNSSDFSESRYRIYVPAYSHLFRSAGLTLAGFSKPRMFCKSGFRKPLHRTTGRFQKAGHDCVNNINVTSSLRKGNFTLISGLLKPGKSSL